MQRLWAPWRMEYISGLRQAGCFLCEAFQSDRDEEHLIVRRGETCALIMNRYPYNNGHLMVAPYRHVAALADMQPAELTELMEMAAMASRLLTRVINAQGFNFGVNQGAAAGAGLKDHLHLHVVPRWDGDTNFMPVLAEVKVVPQPLTELFALLCKDLCALKCANG